MRTVDTPFLWISLLWVQTTYPSSLSPSLQYGGEDGDRVDCTSSNLEFCFSLPLNWPILDEQELTNSLKSPREDEQCYAAYVRSSKGMLGGQLPGVVAEMERENQLKVDVGSGEHPSYKFQLCPEDNNS